MTIGGLLAGVSTVAGPAAAHPGPPSNVFDRPAVAWASVRDQSSAAFTKIFQDMKAKGYLVIDLEVDASPGDYRVGAVFERNTDNRTWRSLRDMTETQYAAEKAKAVSAGQRPVDFETYQIGGQRRYAAVWVQNLEKLGSAVRHDLTSAAFSAWFQEQKAAGRLPVDIEQYRTPAGMRYAAVWVDNKEKLAWQLHRDLTSAQYATLFAQNQGAYRMLGLDSVTAPVGQRYAGIWVANPSKRQWRERRDMTVGQWNNWWSRYADEGYRLISYERYATPAGIRYAGIWRQNSDRPAWNLRASVDARIQKHVTDNKVPGVSVAIVQNGQYRYLRGFGRADVANDVWLDSKHVLGLASVSKAVAGTLTLRLAEQNKIKVTEKTSKYLPTIPSQHTHTVKQLADNQGCVQHYNEGGGFGTNTPYATSLASAKDFWADPLVCEVGAYHYSTHGYTILCAALEQATGQDTATLIRTRLTTPYGLGTLRAKRLTDTGVRRSPIYDMNNKKIPFEDESAKTCGGGMESTPADIAWFGHRLAKGDILSAASMTAMWGASSGYSYGWSLGTESGHKVVAKDGANTGARSYLRIYPDDGIVVAVMSNRRGHDTNKLAQDLGAMVLGG
ncbi:MAG TPA: serine hydrolase [Pilimelia sp.]|nr:serine hydrolase [Pilimelia sp.]